MVNFQKVNYKNNLIFTSPSLLRQRSIMCTAVKPKPTFKSCYTQSRTDHRCTQASDNHFVLLT